MCDIVYDRVPRAYFSVVDFVEALAGVFVGVFVGSFIEVFVGFFIEISVEVFIGISVLVSVPVFFGVFFRVCPVSVVPLFLRAAVRGVSWVMCPSVMCPKVPQPPQRNKFAKSGHTSRDCCAEPKSVQQIREIKGDFARLLR
ncbi:hypothetical protein [Bifidobacterium callitrichos]|uniref:hypothetical protein n=1 Tax=Bifidobacterium callitrichos TaxID=762209 RepID=UPI001CC31E3C|nr:hypothetical protein [Bifidobacterium callitrichos]